MKLQTIKIAPISSGRGKQIMKINNRWFYLKITFGDFLWGYQVLRLLAKHNLSLRYILIIFMPKDRLKK